MSSSAAVQRLRAGWDRLARADIERRQAAILQRYLREQVVPFSQHYRELFAERGLRPEHLRSLADLAHIPFSSKADLLTTPAHPDRTREFVLIPDEGALARRGAVRVRALLRGRAAVRRELAREYRPIFLTSTTGRSTAPVAFLYTQHDLDNLASAGARLVAVMGARPEHRLVNMFPYAPHLAFWQTHYGTQAFNVFCIDTGGGKVMGTEGNLRILDKVQPTAIIGMPTFMYHVLSEAREAGKRFAQLGVLVLGGEKVPPGMRRKLRELVRDLGGKDAVVVASYGFTEGKQAWGECPVPGDDAPPSGYHLYPDLGVIELVDPKTGAPAADGQGGEIVFTPLDARGSVLLRYRTGDVIDGGLVYGACPHCGRMAPRLVGNISRQSEVRELRLDKIRGTLVDFNELEHLLDDAPAIGAWQLEIRKIHDDPLELDELILHVEQRHHGDEELLRQNLSDLIVAHTELRPNQILFHSAREMRKKQGVGVEMKERRLVDHRPQPGLPAPPRSEPAHHGTPRPANGRAGKAGPP